VPERGLRWRIGAAVTQILVAFSAAAGVIVVGWLLVSGRRVLSQTRARRSAESRSSIHDAGNVRDAEWIYGDRAAPARRAPRIPSESGETNQEIPPEGHEPSQTLSAAEAILRDAEVKAAEILARAERERESLLEERLASAERAALEMKDNAEREAEAIVKNAERKAGEALSGVELARSRLEQEKQEVGREQTVIAAKHKRLSQFLLTALEEIERASVNGSANIRGLQELRDKLRSSSWL
jgi:F0F1-type ATP synthase membrane subunit b/b'